MIQKILVGKRIKSVLSIPPYNLDIGMTIIFEDDTQLEIGHNNFEGILNLKVSVDELLSEKGTARCEFERDQEIIKKATKLLPSAKYCDLDRILIPIMKPIMETIKPTEITKDTIPTESSHYIVEFERKKRVLGYLGSDGRVEMVWAFKSLKR